MYKVCQKTLSCVLTLAMLIMVLSVGGWTLSISAAEDSVNLLPQDSSEVELPNGTTNGDCQINSDGSVSITATSSFMKVFFHPTVTFEPDTTPMLHLVISSDAPFKFANNFGDAANHSPWANTDNYTSSFPIVSSEQESGGIRIEPGEYDMYFNVVNTIRSAGGSIGEGAYLRSIIFLLDSQAGGSHLTIHTYEMTTIPVSPVDGNVLYSENFDSYANGTLPQNWVVASPSGVTDISVQDGGLVIKAAGTNDTQTRVFYAGDELKNYGDYTFEADYSILAADYELSASSRYSSMAFRVNGTSASSYYTPYYYVTTRVRSNTTGDELSVQKSGGSGNGNYQQIVSNVYQPVDMVLNQTYHLKVVCRGANIQFYIDDVQILNQTLDTTNSSYPYITTGSIGFNTSNLTVRFDNIVVTEEAGTVQVQPALYDTYIPTTDLVDPPSVIANVTSSSVLSTVEGTKLPSTTFYYLNKDLNVTSPDGSTVIMSLSNALNKTNGKVIPALYIRDNATVIALKEFVNQVALQDAFLVSDSASVLTYARQQMPNLYGALYTKLTSAADDKALAKIVSDTNTALAKTVLVDAQYVTKTNVEYLQKRLMNVWVIGDLDQNGIYENLYKGVDGIICENHSELMSAIEGFNSGTKILLRKMYVAGHRGYMSQYPQNTILSYSKSIEYGADLVETDVRLSADGIPMIYHNEKLADLTSCTDTSKTIENSTYDEIKQYTVNYTSGSSSSEHIPSLREYLELLKSTGALGIVEIKNTSAELVEKVAAMFQEMDVLDQVVVIAFEGVQCTRMRAALPGLSVGLLGNYNSNYNTTTSILTWAKNCITPYTITFHPNYGAVYSNSSFRNELIIASTQRGIHYQTWTYYDQATTDSSIFGGVRIVTTNNQEYMNTYYRSLSTGNRFSMEANKATSISAVVENALDGEKVVNITGFKRISGDDITFRYSAGKLTADKEGVVTGLPMYKASSASMGTYYLIGAPMTITVAAGAPPVPTEEFVRTLLPASADEWTNSMSGMNIDPVKNSDGSYTLKNTSGSWPAVDYLPVGISATLDDHIDYDLTVGGNLSLVLILNEGTSRETEVSLQKYFEGTNTFAGDDLVGNGASFSGRVDLYDCVPDSAVDDNGEFTISKVRVFNVAQAGKNVVLRKLDLVQDVPTSVIVGDLNGDLVVNTSDARIILASIVGNASLSATQFKAADFNGDGKMNTLDVRKMLLSLI